MSTEPQFTKRRKAFYIAVWIVFLIAGLLLYGIGLRDHNSILQGLSLTIPLAPLVWGMAFLREKPQFSWHWRTKCAIAIILASIIIDGLLSILASSYSNGIFAAIGAVVCVVPISLFRIIERQKTA